jgi:uncharacterized ferritin-like protein (DUF455 family)
VNRLKRPALINAPTSLRTAAVHVLNTPDPVSKVELTRRYAAHWQSGDIADIGETEQLAPPDQPPLPDHPKLLTRRDMPKRPKGNLEGRVAFIHAIAHIEFIAINLAWDLIARFGHQALPRAFHDDWVGVACDEANHFHLLQTRLLQLGSRYGELPAHAGLWESATDTADDILARLAIVPMVLEARGLDTTPKAINDLLASGDKETAAIMETIAAEEIPHVQAGVRWFEHICTNRCIEPVSTFHTLVQERFKGTLKPPFNNAAREQAGMHAQYFLLASP